MKTATLLLFSLALCFGQSATPITYPAGSFKTPLVIEAQTVPSSPTTVITGNFILDGGFIACSSTQSITITDGNAVSIMPAILVTAPAIVSLNIFAGLYVSVSFTISATGSGCTYSMFGRR